MSTQNQRQNIKDIAKLAGVSHTTVSRVINNSNLVRPATKQKVMRFIDEGGFMPNIAARGLITGKTYIIGLLVMYDINQFPSDFLPPLLQGMTPILNEYGYSLTLLFDNIDGQKNMVPVNSININRMDAIFILGVENPGELYEKSSKISIPKIFLNLKPQNEKTNFIVSDDYGGALKAVEHLIYEGHKKIGFIGGPPNYTTSIDRKHGYISALERNGIEYLPEYESIGYFNVNKGYEAMKNLLTNNPGMTAVFSANDLMALGAIKAIKECGMKVPEDIAIVGFDNQEFTEYLEPSLTTVKKPRTLMGKLAAEKLISMINGEECDTQGIILPTELIIRESSKKR